MNGNRVTSSATPVILAIDDDPSDLELIQRVLVRNGFHVQTALSAEEALVVMQDVIPAVLVVDVMLPGMSGYDLCSYIKQDKRLKDVPVVILSGRDSSEDFKTGHTVGALFYLSKSSGLDRLLNVVRTLCPLGAKRAGRA
jgi:two-component system, sensor histidine kinase ChiS